MQQTSRHFLFTLSLLILGISLILGIFIPSVSRAQSNQQVTAGVGATTMTINGQTSPDTFVNVLRDSTPIGSTSADSNGAFSLTLNFETGGIKELKIYGTTPDGDVTDPLIASINAVNHQNTVYFAFLPPTIALDSTQVAAGHDARVSGKTIPNGRVVVTTEAGLSIQTIASASGKWAAVIQSPLPGIHNLFAVAYDDNGKLSPATRRLSFIVKANDTVTVPIVPIIPNRPSPAPAPPTPIITSPQNNQYLNTRTVTVKGTADRNSLVEIWAGNRIVGSTYASDEGAWRLSFTTNSPQTIFRARSCLNQTCSDYSSPITVYLSTSLLRGSLFTILEVPEYNFTVPSGEQIILPLLIDKGTGPYAVTIDWGDNSVASKTYPIAGRYTLVHTYKAPGLYNGLVTVEDSNNVKDVHQFAVKINPQSSPLPIGSSTEWLLLGIAVLLALQVALSYRSSIQKRIK